jgi:prepilin-type N-terminal cleavage/methylation domain-containing protein
MKTTGNDFKIRSCRGNEADGWHFAVIAASSRRQLRAAFSLLEVMIAILILGIAIVGFTQGITTALSSGKESELQTTASLFAAGQIEKLRAEGGIKDGDNDGDCGDDLPLYRWKQTITAAGIDGLHEVVIAVEDTRSGKPVYELRTFLFERPEDADSTKDKSRKRNSSSTGGSRQ